MTRSDAERKRKTDTSQDGRLYREKQWLKRLNKSKKTHDCIQTNNFIKRYVVIVPPMVSLCFSLREEGHNLIRKHQCVWSYKGRERQKGQSKDAKKRREWNYSRFFQYTNTCNVISQTGDESIDFSQGIHSNLQGCPNQSANLQIYWYMNKYSQNCTKKIVFTSNDNLYKGLRQQHTSVPVYCTLVYVGYMFYV